MTAGESGLGGGLTKNGASRKVDVRLPGKWDSNSYGARPVHLISGFGRVGSQKKILSLTAGESGLGGGRTENGAAAYDVPLSIPRV